jgi:hypothetical protein
MRDVATVLQLALPQLYQGGSNRSTRLLPVSATAARQVAAGGVAYALLVSSCCQALKNRRM